MLPALLPDPAQEAVCSFLKEMSSIEISPFRRPPAGASAAPDIRVCLPTFFPMACRCPFPLFLRFSPEQALSFEPNSTK